MLDDMLREIEFGTLRGTLDEINDELLSQRTRLVAALWEAISLLEQSTTRTVHREDCDRIAKFLRGED